MSEISLQVRNASFLSRGLMFGGVIFVVVTLQFLPDSLSLFLFAILITLIGIYVYFNTPKLKIIILGLEGDTLNYTSSANPFFAVGDLYDKTESVKLTDIAYIGMEKLYVHDVGHYLHIKLYLKDIGITSIWIDVEHTEKSWGLMRSILNANDDIKILVSNYKEIKHIFSEFSNRFVDELSDGENFEPWKINTSKRDLFTDDEWLQILLAPVCIFNMVAKADGIIQPQEINIFVNKLKESEQYKSFFVAEVFSASFQSFDMLFDKYEKQMLTADAFLKHVFTMLVNKVSESDLLSFSQSLIDLSEELARAAGERYNWVSDEEEKVLNKIRVLLP